MRSWFESVFGPAAWAAEFAAFLLAIVLALGLAAFAVRRLRGGSRSSQHGGSRLPRLAILEVAVVDERRRLLLVRRDQVEHLVMIGGPSDIVVESGIARTGAGIQTGVTSAPAEPQLRETPAAHGSALPRSEPAAPDPMSSNGSREADPIGANPALAGLAAGVAALAATASSGVGRRNGRSSPSDRSDGSSRRERLADEEEVSRVTDEQDAPVPANRMRPAEVAADQVRRVAAISRPRQAPAAADRHMPAARERRPGERQPMTNAEAAAPPEPALDGVAEEAPLPGPRETRAVAAPVAAARSPRQAPRGDTVPAVGEGGEAVAPTAKEAEADGAGRSGKDPQHRTFEGAYAPGATTSGPASGGMETQPAVTASPRLRPEPLATAAERDASPPNRRDASAAAQVAGGPRPEISPAAGVGVTPKLAAEPTLRRRAARQQADGGEPGSPRAPNATLGDLAARLEAALAQQAAVVNGRGTEPASPQDITGTETSPAAAAFEEVVEVSAVARGQVASDPAFEESEALRPDKPDPRRSAFDSLEDEMARLLGELTSKADRR
jgi:hypothetical protein